MLRALRLDPTCYDAHNLLGAVLDREGRHDEAMAHYVDALRIDPEYAAAQNNLGSALARQGRLEKRHCQICRGGAAQARLSPLARKNLAKALATAGRLAGRFWSSMKQHGSHPAIRACTTIMDCPWLRLANSSLRSRCSRRLHILSPAPRRPRSTGG